jgi:hypothetical protein
MRKEFQSLVESWWRILKLKILCSWWNWENWNSFWSEFLVNDFLLCLEDD